MKLLIDLILLAASLASVFYTAGLGNVPHRVRFSVLAIGPSFFLTFLLHLAWAKHLDYGLGAIGLTTVTAAAIGYHYKNTGPMSKAERSEFVKRFAIILSISIICAGLATVMILKVNTDKGGSSRAATAPADTVSSQPSQAEAADQKKWDELTKP